MTRDRTQLSIGLALVAVAALLHGYEHFVLSEAPSPGFFLWAMLPYFACAVAAALSRTAIPAIGAASVALLLDGFAHYVVFIDPQGSTAALALLFVPLWNTIACVPIALVVGYVVVRKRRATPPNEP